MKFGRMLRQFREELGFGLREFADLVGVKASNLSNVENSKKSPFFSSEVLHEMACHLELEQHSARWYAFFDAAQRDAIVPSDVAGIIEEREESVTSLLRTVGRLQLNDGQIRELDAWIEKQWSGNTYDEQ